MTQENTEVYIRHKFAPGTKGYVLKDSTDAYRPATYSVFLDFVKGLEHTEGLNVSYVVANRKGPSYKFNGKTISNYDVFVIAYLKRYKRTVDKITFYAVKRYAGRKMTIVRPNSRNSDYYKEMKKAYRIYKRM